MRIRIVGLLFTVLLTGCSGVQMSEVESNELLTVAEDKSRVVFMRSSVVAEISSLALVDVTSGEPELIGILNNDRRIAFDVPPGKRTFMLVADSVDFLNAELTPGLTYYGLVEPTPGSLRAYFSMWPIRNDPEAVYSLQSDEFKQWLNDTQLVKNNEDSQEWFEENRDDVIAKYQQYWPEWNTHATIDIERQTLLPQDGR